MDSPLAVTIPKGAKLLGVGTSTLYRWVEDGRITAFEYPGMHGRRVKVADLERIIEDAKSEAEREREELLRPLRLVGHRG